MMKKRTLYSLSLFYLTAYTVFAQEKEKKFHFNLTNIGELQYNRTTHNKNQAKGVNLTEYKSSYQTDRFWKNGLLELAVLGVVETSEKRMTNDKLIFSNIEATNQLSCSKLGYQHTFKNICIFGGIRNVNTDYFTTPYSSLFTNSSAGIFPTISLNYTMANYPMGAFGFHAEYKGKKVRIKNSFYNKLKNTEDKRFFKFQFDPGHCGYTNMNQVMYTSPSGKYCIGSAVEKRPKETLNGSVFGLVEQAVFESKTTEVGIIGQVGAASKSRNYCYAYQGIGTVISGIFEAKRKDNLAIIVYHASMQPGDETAIEFTYQYQATSFLTVQPTLHLIDTDNHRSAIALMRAIITLGN